MNAESLLRKFLDVPDNYVNVHRYPNGDLRVTLDGACDVTPEEADYLDGLCRENRR